MPLLPGGIPFTFFVERADVRRTVLIVFCLLAWSGVARAETIEGVLQALSVGSYDDKGAAIKALDDMGDSRAAPALEAMAAGDLYVTARTWARATSSTASWSSSSAASAICGAP